MSEATWQSLLPSLSLQGVHNPSCHCEECRRHDEAISGAQGVLGNAKARLLRPLAGPRNDESLRGRKREIATPAAQTRNDGSQKSVHPSQRHCDQGRFLSRRGNLRCQWPTLSLSVIARRDVFCPDVAISGIQVEWGTQKPRLLRPLAGPRNDEKRERVSARNDEKGERAEARNDKPLGTADCHASFGGSQ